MTPAQIERVFGLGRLKMATGEHVEVFREAVAPGERRRYTKRFLATSDADFGQWTEREWRILARLIGHGIRCVPDVVQFDGGAMGGIRLVQTYDAGVTVDQWATLLPVYRDGAVRRHVFEDCAHWWALAHYCVAALDEIHSLQLVHLDIKGDNICIPYGPANFDPDSSDRLYPIFGRLALIDFAFSLVSRENLSTPLPIGWQKDYDYQSPRLLKALDAGHNGDLQPTKELDWRCDLYSLAAMLKRYLPGEAPGEETGWTPQRYDDARAFVFRLRECHDRDLPHWRPHQQLMDFTGARTGQNDLAASLNYGWELARDVATRASASPITPMTRIVPSIRAAEPIRIATQIVVPTAITPVRVAGRAPPPRRSLWRATVLAPVIGALVALAAPPFIGDPEHTLADRARGALDTMRSMFEAAPTERVVAESSVPAAPPPLQSVFAQSPPVDRMPARAEAPDAVAPVAPKVAGEDPVAKPSSPIDEPKVSSPVAQARAKPGAPPTRTQSVLNSSQSASGIARPAHPLSRWASTAIPKPSRAPSIAGAGVSGHSSRRQALAPQQRFLAPPPPVQVAAASAASGAPIASSGTDPPSSAPSNLAAQQRSSQPSAAADQAPAEPTGTVTEDRRKPTAGTIASSTATSQRQRNPQNQQTFSDWRTLLANLGTVLRGRDGPPASVEERSIAAPAPQAAPRLPASTPRASSAPAPSERLRAEASPFATPAPLATPSTLVADARTQVTTSGISAPPVPSSPPMGESVASSRDRSQDVLVAQARRMVADTVPSIAARVQPDVSRVLGLAATANHQSQQQAVVDAARARWSAETAWTPATDIDPIRARRLHDDARQAFASGRMTDAVDIESRAFAANPRDPDIASYLAFLHIRMHPVQPETARQLALYTIFVSGSRRSVRSGDWGTLAIASALAGRDIEATHAFFVEVALTSNLDRTCQSALSAYASFGERLRVPVQAMLDRIDSNGRVSPYCDWPSAWRTAAR